MQDLGEDVAGAVWYEWRGDGGGSEESVAVQPGEEIGGASARVWGEEEAEAEGEEVGGVAWAGDDVAGDVEVAVPDLDGDSGLEELRGESGHYRVVVGDKLDDASLVS